MFLLIESGYQVQVLRQLAPNESLDVAHHAERYGQTVGVDVDTESPCEVGLGADVDVTIRYTKSTRDIKVFNSRGFYFKPE